MHSPESSIRLTPLLSVALALPGSEVGSAKDGVKSPHMHFFSLGSF